MPWQIWAVVIYLIIDRLMTVAAAGRGRFVDLTWGFAITSLITGALMIWAIVSGVS